MRQWKPSEIYAAVALAAIVLGGVWWLARLDARVERLEELYREKISEPTSRSVPAPGARATTCEDIVKKLARASETGNASAQKSLGKLSEQLGCTFVLTSAPADERGMNGIDAMEAVNFNEMANLFNTLE